jgi:hypothetical protein
MFLSLIYIKGQFVEAFVRQVGLLYKKTRDFNELETNSAKGISAIACSFFLLLNVIIVESYFRSEAHTYDGKEEKTF